MPAETRRAIAASPYRVAFVATLAASLSAPGCAPGGERVRSPVSAAQLQAAADTLLRASAAAWNAGDLDGFLAAYARSPETTYIGARGLVRGWEGIRARYAPLFEPGAARDSLRFEGLEVRPLGPDLGLAVARYVLFRNGAVTDEGIFTLVLGRGPEGWRILHDHSSALARER